MHQLFCDPLAAAVIAAKTIAWRLKHAVIHGFATAGLCATKISNVATFYYLVVRDMMCWWLAHARKKMWWWIIAFGYSYHDDMLLYHLVAAILAAAIKTISQQCMQAAHRVAKVSSATKATNAAICHYCAASLYYTYLFVRESWLWHVFLPRLDSYFFRDGLQNGKWGRRGSSLFSGPHHSN